MFTKLFLQTTDPKLDWSTFFSTPIMVMVILSIIFHTILYTAFLNIASFVFLNKFLNKQINARLICCLFLIMFFGYIGRLWHSKETLQDFSNNYEKAKYYLQQHYNSWIFIG